MLGLAFSGGKDSLACWYLYRHQQPTIIWVNTGKAYPETLAVVDEVRAQADTFIEVHSDQAANIAQHGLPSDLVPIDWTPFGMVFTGPKPVKVQSYLGCCMENISKPIMRAAHEHGITRLIRGQRNDDGHKAISRNGDFAEGIEFLHPIEDWSRDDVLAFVLKHRGTLPEHFSIGHSSLDCYDCTAYAKHSHDRAEYTKRRHPELYADYSAKIGQLCEAINEPLMHYRALANK